VAIAHRIELWALSSGRFSAICRCGWVCPTVGPRSDVVAEASDHASDAVVVEVRGPNAADGPRATLGYHTELPTALVDIDGRTRFLAHCICGWVSEPLDSADTVLAWERHARGEDRPAT
jgi:hypothetical protein